MVFAIILAGGVGSRVGKDVPKQFVSVLGKPILAHTLDIYQRNMQVDGIEIVCHAEWIEYTKNIIEKYNYDKVKWIVKGGENFQKSVINGVNNLKKYIDNEDIVMLHYAAAPFTSQRIIDDNIKVCRIYGNAIACTPCYQLMGTNDSNNTSIRWVDRDKFIQIACPQSFKFDYLDNIYKRAKENNILDVVEPHTTSLMYKLGDVVYQSYSDQTNIKITTKEDIELFEGYVLRQKKY